MLGLVLGGGGVRCLSHLGLAEALQEEGLRPDMMVASSTGTVIALLLASGLDPLDIRAHLFSNQVRFSWWRPSMRHGGLFSQQIIERILQHFNVPARLEDLPIPVHIVITDLELGTEEIVCHGDTAAVACASCALPLIYPPIEIGGRLYADGGIVNNVPADVARRVIGSDGVVLVSSLEMNTLVSPAYLRTFPQVVYRSIYLPQLYRRYRNMASFADLVVEPYADEPLVFNNWRKILKSWSRGLMLEYYERGRLRMQREMPGLKALIATRLNGTHQPAEESQTCCDAS